jgi:hypothetical protein
MKNQRYLKLIIFSTLFLSLFFTVNAKKISNLPGLYEPFQFEVYGNYIYVGEKSTISIYSLLDFSLIKKFGRKGEGPGEFKAYPMVKVFPKYVVVNNLVKWLLFSRKGEFIKEKRGTFLKFFLYPVGNNFVATCPLKNGNDIIKILNEDLEPIKEISRQDSKGEVKRRHMEMIRDFYKYRVYDDKIFLGDTTKGFYIAVFDSNGNKLYEINKKFQPIKVTEKYKKDALDREKKSNDLISNTRRRLKYKYLFKDYFPAFKDFRVKDKKIYVFTYKRKENQCEIIVMDLHGKTQKKAFVERVPLTKCSISNNKYFYLKDNYDIEEWELFAEDL